MENECMTIPRVMSSGLTEHDIIFGGEKTLAKVITQVASKTLGYFLYCPRVSLIPLVMMFWRI